MRDTIIKWISDFIDDYCKKNNLERIWEEPIVGFADANSDYIKNLKNVVLESHYSPKDFLEDATIIVSYFLSFKREIGKSNKCEGLPSEAWAKAYIDTNKMAQDINEYIVDEINTNEKRIYAPNYVSILNGKPQLKIDGTSSLQSDGYQEINEDIKQDMKDQFQTLFDSIQTKACSTVEKKC